MKNLMVNILTGISVFVCFITLLALIFIINISYFFTSENITNTVIKMDMTKTLSQAETVSSIPNEENIETEVLDNAYRVAQHYGVSSDVIDEMVEDKAVKEFFGKIAGNITDYLINGIDGKIVTSKDFNEILDNNIDRWIKDSNAPVDEAQKQEFLNTVKKESGQIIDNLPNSSEIAKKIGTNEVQSVRLIFDNDTKMVLSIVLILSLILIIILKWKGHKNIMYIGYISLISGLIVLATGLISNDLISIVLNQADISLDAGLFGDVFARQLIITSIILITVSLIMYILHLILKRKTKENVL